jgi:hypothetical protein
VQNLVGTIWVPHPSRLYRYGWDGADITSDPSQTQNLFVFPEVGFFPVQER